MLSEASVLNLSMAKKRNVTNVEIWYLDIANVYIVNKSQM